MKKTCIYLTIMLFLSSCGNEIVTKESNRLPRENSNIKNPESGTKSESLAFSAKQYARIKSYRLLKRNLYNKKVLILEGKKVLTASTWSGLFDFRRRSDSRNSKFDIFQFPNWGANFKQVRTKSGLCLTADSGVYSPLAAPCEQTRGQIFLVHEFKEGSARKKVYVLQSWKLNKCLGFDTTQNRYTWIACDPLENYGQLRLQIK